MNMPIPYLHMRHRHPSHVGNRYFPNLYDSIGQVCSQIQNTLHRRGILPQCPVRRVRHFVLWLLDLRSPVGDRRPLHRHHPRDHRTRFPTDPGSRSPHVLGWLLLRCHVDEYSHSKDLHRKDRTMISF